MNDVGTVAVLLVEDDEDDYLITRDLLRQQNRTRFVLDWCSDFETAKTVMSEQRHGVYLIDYRLGEHTGLDLVRSGFAGRPTAPVIMLTSQTDFEIDLEATSVGVTDFLLKQELNPLSLERSIRYAISHHDALRNWHARRRATPWRPVPSTTASGTGTWTPTGCTSRRAGERSSASPSPRPTTRPTRGSSSSTPTMSPGCAKQSQAI